MSDPAAVVPTNNGPCRWEIVRYERARWALATPRFSKDPGLALDALGYDGAQEQIRNLANSDPPDHTRLRRHLAAALTPGRVHRLRPRIAQLASGLAGAMAPAGRVDLVRSFAGPLHTAVMGELLGVPAGKRALFGRLAAGLRTPGAADSVPPSCHEAYRQLSALIAELLAARRAEPGRAASPDRQPDVLSALVSSRVAGERLTPREAQDLAMLLLSAGQEPTVDLIGNAVLLLLLNPGQLRLLRAHPVLRAQAVEEVLRCGAPVLAAPRIAAADIELDGARITRGSVVAARLDHAHRDPARFREPAEFRITRRPNPHLAFGHGIHYCVGAPLARLQANVALAVLLARFPQLTLAPPEPCWSPLPGRRGLVELTVDLGSGALR